MKKVNLNGIWRLIANDGRAWDTEVPGTVMKTLLDNGVIPDPFDGMNEEEACRQMDQDYIYERVFDLPEEALNEPHIDLVFDGIDTIAEIELNGVPLASVKNMHRAWRFDIKPLAQAAANRLRLTFHSAMAYVRQAALDNPDVTYDGGSELRWTGALRKAHYMFGWDWGPRLPDAGLWREVRVEAYSCRLEQIRVHQEHGNDGVCLTIQAETEAEELSVELKDPDNRPVQKITVNAARPAELRVPQPRLWWPNGLGEHPLYTLTVRALRNGEVQDGGTLKIGLRTLTVSTEKDQWGSEFAFCCNGVKFFAMGADYIPEDNLLTRVYPDKTRRLLQDCQTAHFNCVRVWGGGIYPDDSFWEICDELGIVVWMDLMYACNVYKLTEDFRENIIAETRDNLRRIRHHASLGLICGNNEMEVGWVAWENVRNEGDEMRAHYLEQFEHVLKDVCHEEAPDHFYWPSSPSSAGHFDDPNDLNRGDVHEWSVWHGRRPFSDYTERYPRFCSEFGFESFPDMETLKTFIHEEKDLNPFSEVMEAHQKCHNGNSTILFYLAQTLRYPFSMNQLIYSSQYLQAEAVRAGVEHWRRNRGRCMGAIYWQLNDCWPVASWASIDSCGRWKALQYAAKRFFAPVLVSLEPGDSGEYRVIISNEQRTAFTGTVVLTTRNETGAILTSTEVKVSCPAMSTAVAAIVPGDSQKKSWPVVRCVLKNSEGITVSENEAIHRLPKHFNFATPTIRSACAGNTVTISADVFCMGVALSAGDAIFSDNWFSLYPGESRVITADSVIDPEKLVVRCLSEDK